MSMLSSRSASSAAIALALLATPVASFLLLRPDARKRSTLRANQSALPVPRPPTSQDSSLLTTPQQLAAARSSARRFDVQYAAYIRRADHRARDR